MKRLTVLAGLLLTFGGLLLATAPVLASEPGLDRPLPLSILFPELLANNCNNLQGGKSGKLATYCTGIPSGGSAGFTSIDTRTGGSAEAAIRKRQERLRGEGGASADGNELGRGFGFFVTTDYQSLNKSTSMFELGYEQNTAGATAGVDYSFGRLGVLGAAFNYGHEFGDFVGQRGGYDNDLYSFIDRKSTRLNSSHIQKSRMPSSA